MGKVRQPVFNQCGYSLPRFFFAVGKDLQYKIRRALDGIEHKNAPFRFLNLRGNG